MRVSREQVQENKRLILEAASQLFRERGFEAVTVNDVMTAVGLTHGGFYSYFRNKEDLITQALAAALGSTGTLPADLATFAAQYLSLAHRDDLACGCPVAALASETIRQDGGAREEMTAGLRRQIAQISRITPGADEGAKRRAAIGTWSAMVGAMILARMSDDPKLSDQILSETKAWLVPRKGRH
jgi:TetR/AcrR family transcriptional repressor of nem operon